MLVDLHNSFSVGLSSECAANFTVTADIRLVATVLQIQILCRFPVSQMVHYDVHNNEWRITVLPITTGLKVY